MVCNVCGTNEATIHLTEIVNGQVVELHICEQCAKEKGADFKSHFSFSDLLAGLADFNSQLLPKKKMAMKCKACGLTFANFGKVGRLGCPDCYDSFSAQLMPLIKRIQRSTQHVGKRPSSVPEKAKIDFKVQELQGRLNECISKEEFEEAAKLRDEIKRLETKKKNETKNEGKKK